MAFETKPSRGTHRLASPTPVLDSSRAFDHAAGHHGAIGVVPLVAHLVLLSAPTVPIRLTRFERLFDQGNGSLHVRDWRFYQTLYGTFMGANRGMCFE